MRGWLQFDPVKDLGPHAPDKTDGDSYYIVSYVQDEDDNQRQLTVLFHAFVVYKTALAQVAVAILEESGESRYLAQARTFRAHMMTRDKAASDDGELDIQTPLGTL